MTAGNLIAASALVGRLSDRAGDALVLRSIRIREDVDALAHVRTSDGLETAMLDLLRWALDSAPDQSEIAISVSRPAVKLSSVGACVFVMRWQLAGARSASHLLQGPVVPIRARTASADPLVLSERAARIAAAFHRVGWTFAVEALSDGEELCARAGCHA